MATIKISNLNQISPLNPNTGNVSFVATDTQSGVSGRITATTLAAGLFANSVLNVGNTGTESLGAYTIALYDNSNNINQIFPSYINLSDTSGNYTQVNIGSIYIANPSLFYSQLDTNKLTLANLEYI